MFTNKLKLNPDKTEFKLIGNKSHRNKFNSDFSVEILNNSIHPAAHAKNLGVYIDSDLNFQHHIKKYCQDVQLFHSVIFAVSENIFSLDASTALANALSLVSSRLDYCNSILHSIPKVHLDRLQRVQNSLARVLS